MASCQFFIKNVSDVTRGGFFPATRDYSKNIPRRSSSQEIIAGPQIFQIFPVQETDRIITMAGPMYKETYENIILPCYEAEDPLCEFSDGESQWLVIITSLIGTPSSPLLVDFSMELRVCRKLV